MDSVRGIRGTRWGAALIAALLLGAALTAPALLSADDGPTAVGSVKVKSGKWKSKSVGGSKSQKVTFKVKGKKVKKLAAVVNATCRPLDGGSVTFEQLSVVTGQKLKIKRSGKFKGDGNEPPDDVGWEVNAKFKKKNKATGKIQVSDFRSSPSRLCAFEGRFTAKPK